MEIRLFMTLSIVYDESYVVEPSTSKVCDELTCYFKGTKDLVKLDLCGCLWEYPLQFASELTE